MLRFLTTNDNEFKKEYPPLQKRKYNSLYMSLNFAWSYHLEVQKEDQLQGVCSYIEFFVSISNTN